MRTLFLALCLILSLKVSANSDVQTSRHHYKWTLMAYMDGYNPVLEDSLKGALQKLEGVGSSEDVAIVLQWGSTKYGGSGHRYLVRQSLAPYASSEGIHSEPIGPAIDSNMGDPSTLRDFLLWANDAYPADHVIVVVGADGDAWHGTGWDPRFKEHNIIQLNDLAKVFDELSAVRQKKNDLVVFDSCLMSSVEVAYGLSSSTEYMAAGEVKLPDDYWIPYQLLAQALVRAPDSSAEDLGRIIAEGYTAECLNLVHAENPEATPQRKLGGIEFGVIRLSALDEVAQKTKTLASALSTLDPKAQLALFSKAEAKSTLFYTGSYGYDLIQLMDGLYQASDREDIKRAANELSFATQNAVLSYYHSSFYAGVGGLSILAPSTDGGLVYDSAVYPQISFSQITGWNGIALPGKRSTPN